MGRPERELPGDGSALTEFARRLRAARRAAGQPSYRRMSAITHFSAATLARAASGQILPSLEVTLAYIAACGGNGGEWQAAWAEVSASLGSQPDPPGPEPRGRGPKADAPIPRQLPSAVSHFVGRADALKILTGLLDDASAPGRTVVISAIDGTAGIGKTALAVHWAHQVADRFPDGQLYVNLRGFDPAGVPVTPTEAIRGFLGALGVPSAQIPAGVEEQAARYRSLVADRRMLVLLDNARDAGQVRPLLPGAPGCLVVVTSRSRLLSLVAVEGAQPLSLDLLTMAEARELLSRRLGAERLAREPQATEALIRLCARLPLALNIAAARAATEPARPLADLAAQLRDARRRLDVLDAGDAVTDMRSVFSWSFRHLGAAAARMFRLLGVHPGPDVSAPVAASLAGIPPDQARQVLGELTGAHLLAEHPPGRFAFHDLLRAYAAEQARAGCGEDERRTATWRTLDHYRHTAIGAAGILVPIRHQLTLPPPQPGTTPEPLASEAEALTWFEAEYPALLAAVPWAARSGFDAHAWQIPWGLAEFLPRCGLWLSYAATQEAAVAAAGRLGDREGLALAHGEFSWALGRLGRYDEALSHLRQAADLFLQIGDQVSQARMVVNHAHLLVFQERHSEARDRAREALALFRAAAYVSGQANALNTIGWCGAQLGAYSEALESCEQALDLLRDLGDRFAEANTLDTIGYIHRHLGQHARGLARYEQAVSLFRELGARSNEAVTLTYLGEAHLAHGDAGSARQAWEQALVIMADLDPAEAETLRARLGRI